MKFTLEPASEKIISSGQAPPLLLPLILHAEVRHMICCWKTFGLLSAAFGLGILLAVLLPAFILVPVSAMVLIAVGIIIHLH